MSPTVSPPSSIGTNAQAAGPRGKTHGPAVATTSARTAALKRHRSTLKKSQLAHVTTSDTKAESGPDKDASLRSQAYADAFGGNERALMQLSPDGAKPALLPSPCRPPIQFDGPRSEAFFSTRNERCQKQAQTSQTAATRAIDWTAAWNATYQTAPRSLARTS